MANSAVPTPVYCAVCQGVITSPYDAPNVRGRPAHYYCYQSFMFRPGDPTTVSAGTTVQEAMQKLMEAQFRALTVPPAIYGSDLEAARLLSQQAEPDAICEACGNGPFAPSAKNRVARSRLEGQDHGTVIVCDSCVGQSRCATPQGQHTLVVTADDEDFRDQYLPFPIPYAHQYGYCSRCHQPMRWNIELQRWRDLDFVDLAKDWERLGRSA